MAAPRVGVVCTVDLSLKVLLLPQLRALREEGFELTAISAPGPWHREVEAEGIRFVPWRSATRAWDPPADVRALRELVRILRRERFDLVHTHTPKAGVIGRVAARLSGTRAVVNTVHGFYAMPDDPFAKRAAVMSAETLGSRLSDKEFFQNPEDLAWLRRIPFSRSNHADLLPTSVDLAAFDPARVPAERRMELRRELGVEPAAPVILAVGRLVAEKGWRELFAAAEWIAPRRPDVRFVGVGGAEPVKASAIPPAEVERARGRMILTGFRDDVRDLMAIADVFVLPSWREGMPGVAVEAAAMGLPMVLSDIRGCRQVASHDREALLVPPRDEASLAAAIERLLDDEPLRDRLGSAARARALAHFDEADTHNKLAASYRTLLNGGG